MSDASILTRFPDSIIAGQTLIIDYTFGDYPATEPTTVVTAYIGNADFQDSKVAIQSPDDPNAWRFIFLSSETTLWPVGGLEFQVAITSTVFPDVLVYCDQGALQVKPTLKDGPADTRTHAEKTLEAINAVIENRASVDQQQYTIAGRSLTRMTVEELLNFRDYYIAQVRRERQENGQGRPYKIKTRFNR